MVTAINSGFTSPAAAFSAQKFGAILNAVGPSLQQPADQATFSNHAQTQASQKFGCSLLLGLEYLAGCCCCVLPAVGLLGGWLVSKLANRKQED